MGGFHSGCKPRDPRKGTHPDTRRVSSTAIGHAAGSDLLPLAPSSSSTTLPVADVVCAVCGLCPDLHPLCPFRHRRLCAMHSCSGVRRGGYFPSVNFNSRRVRFQVAPLNQRHLERTPAAAAAVVSSPAPRKGAHWREPPLPRASDEELPAEP